MNKSNQSEFFKSKIVNVKIKSPFHLIDYQIQSKRNNDICITSASASTRMIISSQNKRNRDQKQKKNSNEINQETSIFRINQRNLKQMTSQPMIMKQEIQQITLPKFDEWIQDQAQKVKTQVCEEFQYSSPIKAPYTLAFLQKPKNFQPFQLRKQHQIKHEKITQIYDDYNAIKKQVFGGRLTSRHFDNFMTPKCIIGKYSNLHLTHHEAKKLNPLHPNFKVILMNYLMNSPDDLRNKLGTLQKLIENTDGQERFQDFLCPLEEEYTEKIEQQRIYDG